jgi:hypothetical protein
MAEQRNTPLEGRRHPSDDLLSSNPQLECLIQDSRLEVLIPNTLKPNTSQHGVRKTTRMWNHPTIGKWWEVYLRATFSPGDVSQPPKSWVLRQPLPTYSMMSARFLPTKRSQKTTAKSAKVPQLLEMWCADLLSRTDRRVMISIAVRVAGNPTLQRKYPRHRLPTPKASGTLHVCDIHHGSGSEWIAE